MVTSSYLITEPVFLERQFYLECFGDKGELLFSLTSESVTFVDFSGQLPGHVICTFAQGPTLRSHSAITVLKFPIIPQQRGPAFS